MVIKFSDSFEFVITVVVSDGEPSVLLFVFEFI